MRALVLVLVVALPVVGEGEREERRDGRRWIVRG